MLEQRSFSIHSPPDSMECLAEVPELECDLWIATPHPFTANFRCDWLPCSALSLVSGQVETKLTEECGCKSCGERGYHYNFVLYPQIASLAPNLLNKALPFSTPVESALSDAYRFSYSDFATALNRLRTALDSILLDIANAHGVVFNKNMNVHEKLELLGGRVPYAARKSIRKIAKLGNTGSHQASAQKDEVERCLEFFTELISSNKSWFTRLYRGR